MTQPIGGPAGSSELAAGMRRTEVDPRVLAQERVDTLLRRGIILSVLWFGGIGSIAGIALAMRASEHIRHSGGALDGTKRIWLCWILGIAGIAVWTPWVLDFLGFNTGFDFLS